MFALKLALLFAAVPFIAARRIPKIIGGEDSDPSHYPYHVAILKLDRASGATRHVCGGAIIDRRYVLTGAHCVHDLASADVLVRAGGNGAPPSDQPHLERRVFRRVARIMLPKDYQKIERYHKYDIAMLKIQGSFDLIDEQKLKKLQLPIKGMDYEGKWATVSGYGVHNSSQLKVDADGQGFKSLRTQVIPVDECQTTRDYIINDDSMCTRSVQKKGHTCYGDGGNPLVYEGQIIGILNNPGTCDDERPEVYTSVEEYLSFIKNVLHGTYSSAILYK